jgi:RNA-directed DNA polymerase
MIIEKMAADLGLQVPFIDAIARGASHAYKTYSIPKRGGGARTIEHPSKQLKALQRWFLQYVIPGLPVHSAATAYQKNHSILDNAAVHAGSKYLLRMDFQSFFPSITEVDVRAYIEDRSSLFSAWSSFDINVFCMIVLRRSRLTIGAPTSPALSNIICFDMDSAFSDLCARHGVTYTRYADDLFFSTTQPNVLRPLQLEVERIISELKLPARLVINAAKTRHSSKRRARRVTGIVLGSDQKAYIGRPLKRKIRALIFKMDSLDSRSRASLAGLVAYAVGFDADFMNSLIMKYGHAIIRKARNPNAK